MSNYSNVRENVLKYLGLKQHTIDEVTQKFSKTTDQMILNVESEEKLLFIGGSFKISASNKKSIKAEAILYFQGDNKEWTERKLSSDLKATEFDDKSMSELLERKTVDFDILHPNKEATVSDSPA